MKETKKLEVLIERTLISLEKRWRMIEKMEKGETRTEAVVALLEDQQEFRDVIKQIRKKIKEGE